MQKLLLSVAMLASLNAYAKDDSLLVEARKVAGSVPPKLLQVLTAEIDKGGPESAIAVCREKAPQMAKTASEQTGWMIRRVSLRNRNPKAIPDTWEIAALEDFDRRAAAGEAPATLEKWDTAVVGDRQEFRYIRALPVQPICLGCHGESKDLKSEVKAKLESFYPADKGVGYSLGQIRGAITIRKSLDSSAAM
jgi:hypothetical protein